MRPKGSNPDSLLIGVDPSTTGGYWALVKPTPPRAVLEVGVLCGDHVEVLETARNLLARFGVVGVVELLPPFAPPQRRVASLLETAYYAGTFLAAGYLGVSGWRHALGIRDDAGVAGTLGLLVGPRHPRRWNAHHRDAALLALAYGMGMLKREQSAASPGRPQLG